MTYHTVFRLLGLLGLMLLVGCTGSHMTTYSPDEDPLPSEDGDRDDERDSTPAEDGDLDDEGESPPSGDGDGDDEKGEEPETPELPPDDPLNLYGLRADAVSARNVRLRWVAPAVSPCTVRIERSREGGDYELLRERDCGRERFLDLALEPLERVQYRLSACDGERCGEPVYSLPLTLPLSALNPVDVSVHDPEMPDVLILCGQLDPDLDYTAFGKVMALSPDGTIWWEYATTEYGAVTEVQPLPDRTLALGAFTFLTHIDLDGTLIHRPTHFTAHHDIDRLPDGRFIFLMFDQFDSPSLLIPGPILGDAIGILNPDGETLDWTWVGRDHIPFSDRNSVDIAVNLFNLGYDWTHANNLTARLDEGVIYINIRNLDRIYAINYPAGDVRWIMGDGGDFGEGLWAHSHTPIFHAPGRVLIFDNGFQRGGWGLPYSRIIDVAFDPEAKTTEIVWEYRESPDFYSFALGGVEILEDGSILATDGMNGRVFVVNRDKTKLWEMRVPAGIRIYKATAVKPDFFLDW